MKCLINPLEQTFYFFKIPVSQNLLQELQLSINETIFEAEKQTIGEEKKKLKTRSCQFSVAMIIPCKSPR